MADDSRPCEINKDKCPQGSKCVDMISNFTCICGESEYYNEGQCNKGESQLWSSLEYSAGANLITSYSSRF